ncbi:unnamed protein product [Trichobilharzia szidati]|nr:unnamed protein product [Trichobilharzia szidati]
MVDSYKKLNERYDERINHLQRISKIITDDMKDAFPSDTKKIDQYVDCINRNYKNYYEPDFFKVTTASLRVLFEEYGELVPDIKWTFQRYKPTLEAHKEWAKSRTYGPEYIGCDEFRPSVSSQGIRSWNLLVSQAYDEITTREEIKALLPIYENLADRLTSAHQWFRSKKQC